MPALYPFLDHPGWGSLRMTAAPLRNLRPSKLRSELLCGLSALPWFKPLPPSSIRPQLLKEFVPSLPKRRDSRPKSCSFRRPSSQAIRRG